MKYGRIQQQLTHDELRASARAIPWQCLGSLGGGVAFFVLARLVYLAGQARPDKDSTGTIFFMWLLIVLGIGCGLLGIETLLKRIIVIIQSHRVTIEQRGLWRKRRIWRVKQDESYLLVLASHERAAYSGKQSQIRRVASLEVVDSSGERQTLLENIEDQGTVSHLASIVATQLELPTPSWIRIERGQDTNLAILKAREQHFKSQRDQALATMRNSVAKMEEAIDTIDDEKERLPEDSQEEAISAADRHRLESELQQKKSELLRAELLTCLQDCDGYEVTTCQMGKSFIYRRMEFDSATTLPLVVSTAGTAGMAILIFMFTPIVIPILGELTLALIRRFPAGAARMQAELAIADLCTLDIRIFLWVPPLVILYTLWTWLKVDASFAPRRINFNWPKRELTIEERNETRQIGFSQIQSVSVATVHRERTTSPSGWKQHGVLFIDTSQSQIPVLESVHMSDQANDPSNADRFEPVANELAQSLDVPLVKMGVKRQTFNAVGYPYARPILHVFRIVQLAGPATRRKFLISWTVAIVLLAILFALRFDANQAAAL